MKITSISKSNGITIFTDEEHNNHYTRYDWDSYTVRMGESDEPLYNCEKIEKLYQEYIKTFYGDKKYYASDEEVYDFQKYMGRADLSLKDVDHLCFGYINKRLRDLHEFEDEEGDLEKFLFKLQSSIGYDLGK